MLLFICVSCLFLVVPLGKVKKHPSDHHIATRPELFVQDLVFLGLVISFTSDPSFKAFCIEAQVESCFDRKLHMWVKTEQVSTKFPR